MFSRSENISCGEAVYHISSEIYHSLRTAKHLLIFGKYSPSSKYVTHYDTFTNRKCHFFLYIEKRRLLLYEVSPLGGTIF